MSQLILYTSDDGRTRIDLRVDGRTVWLTQLEIAELLQTTKQNVSLHARNILVDGELEAEAVVKESLTTALGILPKVMRRLFFDQEKFIEEYAKEAKAEIEKRKLT